MKLEVILLGSGFFFSFVLLVLLAILATQKSPAQPIRKKAKTDLKKIKEQIIGDNEKES